MTPPYLLHMLFGKPLGACGGFYPSQILINAYHAK